MVASADVDSVFRILVRMGRLPEMDESGAEVILEPTPFFSGPPLNLLVDRWPLPIL